MRIRSITLALAAAAALAAPAVATAATKQENTKGVQYKDLDLATEAGQKALESRMDAAAREVCGLDDVRTGTRIASREARECYKSARAQIGEQLSQVVSRQTVGG